MLRNLCSVRQKHIDSVSVNNQHYVENGLWLERKSRTVLINIDNGGTFTDVCVIKGNDVYRAKTPTTPFDLSECFFAGLRQASIEVYGAENVAGLLAGTDNIRYSTTQGTNALVQRKGPRLGLILEHGVTAGDIVVNEDSAAIYSALVNDRAAHLHVDSDAFEAQVVEAVNELTLAGANRLVISLAHLELEKRVEKIIQHHFPEHLLGTVPVVAASEISPDANISRRTWTAMFNAFLHPSMEKFLYYAENRLRSQKFFSPLLIYRNDGDSGKVAKTTAIKTYSSGPRGGMDGAQVLAEFYKLEQILTMDVGGTTTDIGLVNKSGIRHRGHGVIGGATISLPLTDIVSVGVGGGSVISAADQTVTVGPQSVGSAPGPACFGLGGTSATMTDFALLAGIIDPATYFGGSMRLDVTRAESAVRDNVASALDLQLDQALCEMERAWVSKIAAALSDFTTITDGTVLGGFGGAGPLAVCAVAEAAGISTIIIPKMAAVFCALGIGFSDVGHSYELAADTSMGVDEFDALVSMMRERALEDMSGEGFSEADCACEWQLIHHHDGDSLSTSFSDPLSVATLLNQATNATVRLRVSARMPQPDFASVVSPAEVRPVSAQQRRILLPDGQRKNVPLYVVDEQPAGACGDGPAIIEDPYFTLRVLSSWAFRFTSTGDILLSNNATDERGPL